MDPADIELRDVSEGLAALFKNATRKKLAAFRALKAPAKRDLKARGETRTGPDGQRWPSSARSSRIKARRGYRRNRRPGDLGKLPTAWKSFLEPEQLRFVNVLEYAVIHHEGGTGHRGAKIPARPYAGFSKEFADRALKTWAKMVTQDW